MGKKKEDIQPKDDPRISALQEKLEQMEAATQNAQLQANLALPGMTRRGPCRSVHARSTAPGFMMPSGSSAALIARIAASLAGSP